MPWNNHKYYKIAQIPQFAEREREFKTTTNYIFIIGKNKYNKL